MLNPPYEYTGPYARCYEDRQNCIDERHAYIIHELLLAGQFHNVLELGGYMGASSAAFLEAQQKAPSMKVTLCDMQVGTQLREMANHHLSPLVYIKEMLSTEALADWLDYDLVFVDASHDLLSVSLELPHLIRWKPRCIVAHDTSATDHGYECAEGAALLRRALLLDPEYSKYTYEDDRRREGEETHRGLFMATTDPKFYLRAVEIFQQWSAWQPQRELVA